jgi:hypothetical protein
MRLRDTLLILAGAQIALAAVTWWPDTGDGAAVKILDVERETITEVEVSAKPVEGEEPDPAVLALANATWVVRSAADYPARNEKVEELLGSLLGLEGATKVATQSMSHNALKVGDEEYGRRIAVTAGGERIELVIGAATSKSVNVRVAGSDEVYRAPGVSEWAFSETSTSYYDPAYVTASPKDLSALKVVNPNGELTFQREGGALTLAGVSEEEEVDTAAVDRFLQAITSLRMSRPVGETVDDSYELAGHAAAARVDWTVIAEDQSIAGGYAVGAEIDSDRYVKAVDSPFVVRVPSSATERLSSVSRAEFLLPTE